jgi:hypothetical protein
MLDNIILYWLTATAASSGRIYWESFGKDFSIVMLDVPVGRSVFPGDIFRPPKI